MLIGDLHGVIAAGRVGGFVSGITGEAGIGNVTLGVRSRRKNLRVSVVVSEVVEVTALRTHIRNLK